MNNEGLIGCGVIEITRKYDGVKFIKSNFSEDVEKSVVVDITAQAPTDNITLYFVQDHKAYLVSITGDPEIMHVTIALGHLPKLTLPLPYHPRVKAEFEPVFRAIKGSDACPSPAEILDLPIEETLSALKTIDNLDSLLFAIYTHNYLFILGDQKSTLCWIFRLLKLLPKEIGVRKTFSTFTQKITGETIWQGLEANQQSLDALLNFEQTSSQPLTVFAPYRQVVRGNFTSPTTIKLAKAIYQDEVEVFTTTVKSLYADALTLSSDDSVIDIVDDENVSFRHAEFLQAIRHSIDQSISDLHWFF